MALKKNNPGCTCCGADIPVCRCGRMCGHYSQCNPTKTSSWLGTVDCADPDEFYKCRDLLNDCRPHANWAGETCQDLVYGGQDVVISGVTNDECGTCSDYNGTFCLGNRQATVVTVGPADDCTARFDLVSWDSVDALTGILKLATCGDSAVDPLPRVSMEYTDDGSTQVYTVYLNTQDTKGGVASYTIAKADWVCGRDNTLTRATEGEACDCPSTIQVRPCASCDVCIDTAADERYRPYKWTIYVDGVAPGDCCDGCGIWRWDGDAGEWVFDPLPDDCLNLNGEILLEYGTAIHRASSFGGCHYVSIPCAWSKAVDVWCKENTQLGDIVNRWNYVWRLRYDTANDNPQRRIIVELLVPQTGSNRPFGCQEDLFVIARWSALQTSCTELHRLELDFCDDSGNTIVHFCDVRSATIFAGPFI